MPGLAIQVNNETVFDAEHALNSFMNIYKVPGLPYNESNAINGNHVFYNCFPDFIKEKKLAQIDNHIILYDGDFYNSDELCKQLHCKPVNKIELIYLLYQKHGDNLAHFFNGEFNIAIYNISSKRLLVTNDRFARRPFFYFHRGSEFICGSEKKAILTSANKFDIDPLGLLQVFALAHNIEGRTFLKDIFSLAPASVLVFENNRMNISYYFRWYYEAHNNHGKKVERIAKLHKLLANAVNERLANKERISLMLSGGMDSRAIACAIDPNIRKYVAANTCGESDSPELLITSKLSERLKYRHFRRTVDKKASLIAEIGTWRNEFAVSSFRHPFSSFHRELKETSDYVIIGLPGLDYLDGSWVTLRILLYSLFPKSFEHLSFGYLSEKRSVLEKIFNKKYLDVQFPQLKDSFTHSLKRICAANNSDKFDIWANVERGPQFSFMADLVERDLFEGISPFADSNLLRFFSGIPTIKRMMQQHTVALFFNHYPEVKDIEFDSGRGVVSGKNRILLLIIKTIIKRFKKYKQSLVWNFAEAIRNDSKVGQIIIDTISQSDELRDKIFNLDSIKLILSQHYNRTANYSSLIDSLLTFSIAYRYFCSGESIEIPQAVTNYYSTVHSEAVCD